MMDNGLRKKGNSKGKQRNKKLLPLLIFGNSKRKVTECPDIL